MKQKNRISYTSSLKNPLVWLSALLALGAAVLLFRHAGQAGIGGWERWLRGILPGLGALYFVWQLLIHGRDRLYRLTVPFWVLLLGFVFSAWALQPWYWALILTLAALVSAWLMRHCLTGTLSDWPVILLAGAWMVWAIWIDGPARQSPWESAPGWLYVLPELLLLAAYLPLCFAMKRVDDGKYHPTWGDRPDGRRLRSLDPINVVGTYIMPERNQANVFFHDRLEITALEKYIRAKRAAGFEQFSMTEALLAAYVRTVSKFPGANRFISGERIYSRGDDLQFCMTVKKEMAADAPETIIKLHLKPGDSVETVYQKYHDAINDAKKSMDLDSTFDGAANLLGMIPGLVLKFAIWLLKLLDYFGLIPGFLLEVSPFHCSIFFTAMGSLGIPAVYHHLYNFGNLPIFLAFGRKYRLNELADDGSAVSRKYMDYTFNVDERIVDGFYYAGLIKHFHKLLLHPERLDDPEMEINEDIP